MQPIRNRKYPSYDALAEWLRSKKVEYPGKLAGYLLWVFLENDGFLMAEHAIKRGLCAPGKFKEDFIGTLKEMGLVKSAHNERATTYWNPKFAPGPNLARYLNDHKYKTETLATEAQVRGLQEQIDALKARVSRNEGLLVRCCDQLNIRADPPDFKEVESALDDRELFGDAV